MNAELETILVLHFQPFGLARDGLVPLKLGVLLLVPDSSFEEFLLNSDSSFAAGVDCSFGGRRTPWAGLVAFAVAVRCFGCRAILFVGDLRVVLQ